MQLPLISGDDVKENQPVFVVVVAFYRVPSICCRSSKIGPGAQIKGKWQTSKIGIITATLVQCYYYCFRRCSARIASSEKSNGIISFNFFQGALELLLKRGPFFVFRLYKTWAWIFHNCLHKANGCCFANFRSSSIMKKVSGENEIFSSN